MKARYHSKNWAAVYYPKLDAWAFTKIVSRGKRKGMRAKSYDFREVIKFETHFEKAKAEARKVNGNIPATGWIKTTAEGSSVDDQLLKLFNEQNK